MTYENLDNTIEDAFRGYPIGSILWEYKNLERAMDELKFLVEEEFDPVYIEPQTEESFIKMLGMEKQIESIT